MQVTLTRAEGPYLQIVKTFFVSFFNDLSQYDDNLIINDYGFPMWEPAGLPGPATFEECISFNWWVRDECFAYLIRVDGKPAGFLHILAEKKHLVIDVDYELLDFYIAPKYRRQQVGYKAAWAAFDLFHGNWQVFELERNLPARTFWHKLIAEYTDNHYQDLDDGTQQRFQN